MRICACVCYVCVYVRVCFGKDEKSTLKDWVFLSLKWLADVMKSVVSVCVRICACEFVCVRICACVFWQGREEHAERLGV